MISGWDLKFRMQWLVKCFCVLIRWQPLVCDQLLAISQGRSAPYSWPCCCRRHTFQVWWWFRLRWNYWQPWLGGKHCSLSLAWGQEDVVLCVPASCLTHPTNTSCARCSPPSATFYMFCVLVSKHHLLYKVTVMITTCVLVLHLSPFLVHHPHHHQLLLCKYVQFKNWCGT